MNIEEVEKEEEKIEEEEENSIKDITVDIKGRISNPGVYTLSEGNRVMDVITEAGGLLEDANTALINLSKKIEDEMVIIIYSNQEMDSLMEKEKIIYQIVEVEKECPDTINNACINENKTSDKIEEEKKSEEVKRINLNTATIEELTTLPGIGEAKAENIIRYREIFPFEEIEQLKEVSGIGESLFEKVKDYITV